MITLSAPNGLTSATVNITGSKSESNRLLILQALFPQIQIQNLSNSQDTTLLTKALNASSETLDIHHAGTAMRFLTAYLAIQKGKHAVITGSSRMKQRPIGILVDALRDLDCNIEYLENEGYPPLKIIGKEIEKSRVGIDADISSQYITALMLIGPALKNGLEIFLKGKVTSRPYIEMTLALLESIGVKASFFDNTISIQHLTKLDEDIEITVESDWSSASYYYSLVALSKPGTTITLTHFKPNSLQGDSVLAEIYQEFGVDTTLVGSTLTLKKLLVSENQKCNLDLSDSPDIAQTIAVSCFGLGVPCELTGLHTLKIKETDRLLALKNELTKLGGDVEITDSSFALSGSSTIKENVSIKTYDDHRMAMAFAPLALLVKLNILSPEVVEKSYPDFWKDLKSLGIRVE